MWGASVVHYKTDFLFNPSSICSSIVWKISQVVLQVRKIHHLKRCGAEASSNRSQFKTNLRLSGRAGSVVSCYFIYQWYDVVLSLAWRLRYLRMNRPVSKFNPPDRSSQLMHHSPMGWLVLVRYSEVMFYWRQADGLLFIFNSVMPVQVFDYLIPNVVYSVSCSLNCMKWTFSASFLFSIFIRSMWKRGFVFF